MNSGTCWFPILPVHIHKSTPLSLDESSPLTLFPSISITNYLGVFLVYSCPIILIILSTLTWRISCLSTTLLWRKERSERALNAFRLHIRVDEIGEGHPSTDCSICGERSWTGKKRRDLGPVIPWILTTETTIVRKNNFSFSAPFLTIFLRFHYS